MVERKKDLSIVKDREFLMAENAAYENLKAYLRMKKIMNIFVFIYNNNCRTEDYGYYFFSVF